MKKILKFVLPIILSSVFFTGCYDAVFQSIRKEVALEDSEVSGFINDITRYQGDHKVTKKTDNGDGTFTITEKTQTDEFLFLSNGIIYWKQISNGDLSDLSYNEAHGKWEHSQPGIEKISYDYFGAKFDGEYVIKTGCDYSSSASKSTLYALTVLYEKYDTKGRNVPKEFKLYKLESLDGTWTQITSGGITDTLNAYFNAADKDKYGEDLSVCLMSTNSPKKEDRRAFLRIGTGDSKLSFKDFYTGNTVNSVIYELSNGEISSCPYYCSIKDGNYSETITGGELVAESIDYKSVYAVSMNSKVYFFPETYPAVSNADKTSSGDTIWFGNAKNAYWFTEATFAAIPSVTAKIESSSVSMSKFKAWRLGLIDTATNKRTECPFTTKGTDYIEMSTNDRICSIAASKDDILFGTYGNGVFRALIKGSVIEKTTDFKTNAQDIMCSPYVIRTLMIVDPSKASGESSAYSAMDYRYTESSAGANEKNRGLWSYYKNRNSGKGWNKE